MRKILVANRGEIAVRVLRTIDQMGLASVAVYSDVDRTAPFVRMASEAICLGAATPSASYLNSDKIIRAAKDTGCDAIHPGYGFLSENADFAQQVTGAGLIFIGPPASSIDLMGRKLAAKRTVSKYDIPLVPGTDDAIADPKEALAAAGEIGFPVLIKASAGGGGKGMRIVHKPEDFIAQMERARSEAQNAFGDPSVFVEKYISSPRHIEIQILADAHGNCVHLFERECSIQRRHQKVIEEAPSAVMRPDLRSEMGAHAIKVAQSCNYVGAGTVEFIMDEDLNFYFLEMNTRLQVEHPVTEMTTGIDLVEQQIRIAGGEPLSFRQEELSQTGHAIELRVYAEDPANHFLPSIGTLETYRPPQGPGIRVDDGYEEGMDIPLQYDPLLSKLIVHDKDRASAIRRMESAIDAFRIIGVETTLPFGKYVMQSEPFRSGAFDTHFVPDHFTEEHLQATGDEAFVAAVVAARMLHEHEMQVRKPGLSRNGEWAARRWDE